MHQNLIATEYTSRSTTYVGNLPLMMLLHRSPPLPSAHITGTSSIPLNYDSHCIVSGTKDLWNS